MRIPLLLLVTALSVSCSHSTPPAPATTPMTTAAPAASPAASPAAISPIQPNAAVQKEWDPALAALIGRATTMQAARVKLDPATKKWLPGPETNADALARRAATAVLTKTTDMKKKCMFEPGVALRLCDDKKDCAVVLVCYSCSDVAVQKNDGTLTDLLDFQPAKDELVAIAKAAFPNDAEIQKL